MVALEAEEEDDGEGVQIETTSFSGSRVRLT